MLNDATPRSARRPKAEHGFGGRARRSREGGPHTDLLIFLAIGAALGPVVLPRTPIFGGTEHWITAYPFLAGHGFDLVWTRIEAIVVARKNLDATKRLIAQAAIVLVTFGGALATTIHSHPFGLSAYVPFAGGTAAGADLGLNRQFWGSTTESLAPWLAENTHPGETLYFMARRGRRAYA